MKRRHCCVCVHLHVHLSGSAVSPHCDLSVLCQLETLVDRLPALLCEERVARGSHRLECVFCNVLSLRAWSTWSAVCNLTRPQRPDYRVGSQKFRV
eukprot:3488692-Prymnesium_polylepis.1